MPPKLSTQSQTKAPTLKDVAKAAGVSLTTASYVFNGKGAISKSVSEKVMAVVAELGYQPNKAAQSIKTGNSLTIGLLLPDLRYPFFPELASEIEKVCDKHNYSVILANSYAQADTEVRRSQNMVQLGADGLVWFPGSQKNTIKHTIRNMPVVVIDRDLTDFDAVMPDHYMGGQLQAEHLLALGHRNIGIVSGPTDVDNMQLRTNGASESIDRGKANVRWVCQTDFTEVLSEQALTHLLKRDVSAVIAGNDVIALNVIRQLNLMGLVVPDDVSVVGFDDTTWCEMMTPPLTSIRMPLAEMAEEAFSMMIRRKSNPLASRKQCIVGVRLIVRKTTAANPLDG